MHDIVMDDISLREKLADAGRILESEGQGDYCMGHVTMRVPEDPDRILMKAGGMGLEEMTPDNIVTINIEGEKVAGTHQRHNEVFIHTEIMRVRPDIQSVVHTHAPYSVIFSSLGKPLQPVAESAGGAKLVTSPEEAKAKKRITRAENQINLFNYMVRRVARQR